MIAQFSYNLTTSLVGCKTDTTRTFVFPLTFITTVKQKPGRKFQNTVKSKDNDHPWDPKIVAVVHRSFM